MRKINELIWHCTATPEGREVSAAEIDRWHKARGWTGIGYHKVVHLDGSVSDGRPESKIGSHVAGRNTGTLGYVYVGGMTKDMKKPKDTRTAAQKRTMERLSTEAVEKYGLTAISGHSDYANKACPCFNARAEYRHLLHLPADGMPEKDPVKEGKSVMADGTANASHVPTTYGAYESGSDAWSIVDQVRNAKHAASDLGMVDIAADSLAKIVTSPRFLFGAALVAIGLFIWWKRKQRLAEENG